MFSIFLGQNDLYQWHSNCASAVIAGDIVSKLERKTKMETEIWMEALCLALGMSDVDGDVYDDGDDDDVMRL